MTTYSELMASAEAKARPILGEVCATIADVQVRNRGTIGGNVCSNDPTNHLPPLMVAVGARMTIVGAGGEREVPAEEFFLGVYLTAAGPGELLTRISIPAGKKDGFAAVTLGADGTCIANAAASRERRGPRRARLRRRGAGARHGRLARGSGRRRARGEPDAAVRRPRLERVPDAPRRGARDARRGGGGRPLMDVTVTVNGTTYERDVEPRKLLIHFLRDDLDLTGSHIGCDTGNCGACSVIFDGVLAKSCMLLAVQANGASIETVEGLERGRRADAAAAGLQRAPRAPVRLLHAGDADERDRAAAREPEPVRGRDQEGAAGQHLPLHRLLEHRRGRASRWRSDAEMSETTLAPAPVEVQKGWGGQSVKRKEDKRLLQGEGVFVDDIKRHGMGYLHFVRSPYAHAHITRVDVSAAEAIDGVYGTLTGEEVAALTDPFFQISSVPGANIKDFSLAVGKVRYVGEPVVAVVAETRELARDASELVEVDYEPLRGGRRRAHGAGRRHAGAARRRRGEPHVVRPLLVGRPRRRLRRGRPGRSKIPELHFHRFNSTPLECDGALVEFNRGVGQWTIHTNNQFPGFAAIMMGPAMKVGLDKLRFVTQDIGGGFGNKITSHPQLVVCCLLARKLNRPVQWTEWRTDFHLSMSHGNERWFQDTEVAVKDDGTLLGFRTKALDDAGAWLRYEPLGGVIWAQVTPGMYRWRHIELEFTQVATNKAPVSPNRGYSRMQHLWFTERVIDIVARELDLDPVEVRKRNYIRAEDMPYETPNGCVYDSGDYAGMLDLALELID